jgi:hypothetical protein
MLMMGHDFRRDVNACLALRRAKILPEKVFNRLLSLLEQAAA